MAAIDIGAGATDRASYFDTGNDYTCIDTTNPANATGKITSFELWFLVNGVGVKAGTFYGSGTSYTNRDGETIGNVTSGSKQTFSGLDCSVETGDFAGVKWDAGGPRIEADTSGGSGSYYKAGDQFGAGTQTYAALDSYILSIYGTGITLGVGAQYINISPFGVTIFGGKTN